MKLLWVQKMIPVLFVVLCLAVGAWILIKCCKSNGARITGAFAIGIGCLGTFAVLPQMIELPGAGEILFAVRMLVQSHADLALLLLR